MYLINKTWNPDIFQGNYKKTKYFEGWYFKLIDKSKRNVFAVIPGISYGKTKDSAYAFIQVIDGISGKVNFFKFRFSEFKFSKSSFNIDIAGNSFSREYAKFNLKDNDTHIIGELTFENIVPFPRTFFRPGIMGPFSFVPWMECYHGIVNIHNEIKGNIKLNNLNLDFNGGYGYIEKDWGQSFPEAWIWLQSNHFSVGDVSIMFSIAKIPWFHKFFIGFLSFLRIKDKIYIFATYTNAKIKMLNYCNEVLNISIEDNRFEFQINTRYSNGGLLKAPKNGIMDRNITESISAVVSVKLLTKSKQLLFEGEGCNSGLEIAGDVSQFIQ